MALRFLYIRCISHGLHYKIKKWHLKRLLFYAILLRTKLTLKNHIENRRPFRMVDHVPMFGHKLKKNSREITKLRSLLDMPILGFSNSEANKDMMAKILKKWGYNCLIE